MLFQKASNLDSKEKFSSAFAKHKINCRWALQIKFYVFFFYCYRYFVNVD